MKGPDDVGVNTKKDKQLQKPDGRKTNKKLPHNVQLMAEQIKRT